jgi:hypothetical protein
MTLVLLLIEAIFITEKLNDVLRSAIDQHASFLAILAVLLLTSAASNTRNIRIGAFWRRFG